jgi:hypothetical protein
MEHPLGKDVQFFSVCGSGFVFCGSGFVFCGSVSDATD